MNKLTYTREISRNICPLCGSGGELVFRFHCTNAGCKNYERTAKPAREIPKVGDRIMFVHGSGEADWTGWDEFVKQGHVTSNGAQYFIFNNGGSGLYFYKGSNLDGHSNVTLVAIYDKWGLTNRHDGRPGYLALWFPLSACAKYKEVA